MNSREIVSRTLSFDRPERVARSFMPSDFVSSGAVLPNSDSAWRKTGASAWQRTDEWGNTWGRVDDTSMGEVVKGAIEDISDVATAPLPNFADSGLYRQARDIFRATPDNWHIGSVRGFTFKMAQQLRRLEQYLCDLVAELDLMRVLHDRIDEQIAAQIICLKDAGADSIMFWEDWGTQEALQINPRLWNMEFKPRFSRLCRLSHSLGMPVFMHSCGKMTAIIPGLIESGIDVFQFDQPRIHGLETLAGFQASARVTFWSPVDIQSVLPRKDEALIRGEARAMLDALWRGQGGFIAGYYGDNASLGLEPRWQEAACDEFLRYGKQGARR